jgi:hypothetical protein
VSALDLVDRVPAGAWVGLAVGNAVLSVVTWSAAGRRMRRAGQRAAATAAPTRSAEAAVRPIPARDAALTAAAMVPAVLFWGMVLAGSFHGLVEFGRQTLGWHDGWEYLVPGTLDGVSVTFAFLAFRAIRLQKSPVRCQRVVWGAAVASATVNFAYEYGHSHHNVVAGGYLALLSLFGMVMFHEFLNQFEDGTGYVKRENPAFGLRWLTWPTNTFCAAVAWRNYPPTEGMAATVRNAVANLDRVRAIKADAREARIEGRHERTLARTRRHAELTADKAAAAAAVNGGSPAAIEHRDLALEAVGSIASPPAGLRDVPSGQAGRAGGGVPRTTMRVPATAPTLAQWANIWIKMCGDDDLALGPLNDERSRTRYQLSAKQLRNIRHAATSGALRRRAGELGVALPPGYADNPVRPRVNGHDLVGAQVQG